MTNDFNFVTCPKCGHDRNPVTARKCEICGSPLKKGELPLVPLLIGAGALGLMGVGGFLLKDLLLKPQPVPPATPDPVATATGSASQSPTPSTSGGTQGVVVQGVVVQTYSKFADVPNVPQGSFNYGGATTFAPLRSPTILSQFTQVFPQFQLRYTEPSTGKPGSGKGIEMLLDGQLSLAQSSRPLKESEYGAAKTKGFTLDAVPVAIDGIAVFVNPQLLNQGLKGLTVEQLRGIFTGKIRNWKEVGGPDLKITPVSRDPGAGGTVDFFIESVLNKQPQGDDVQLVRDPTAAIRKVAADSGGISYATTSESINQRTIRPVGLALKANQPFVSPCGDPACTTVDYKAFADGSYPITRRLFVIVKRDGKQDEQAGVAYANLLLSDQGQELVKQAGFVPLR